MTSQYAYRHKETNVHCIDYGEWSGWAYCDETKAAEIQFYIDEGFSYELKALSFEDLTSEQSELLRKRF